VARIFLSAPDIGADERALLLDAVDSNWIAPVGPHVDAFEREMAEVVGVGHAVALSSGTAALHLALLLAGVRPDDEVLVPTLTFIATANAVVYAGGRPVFVDSDRASWNVDPDLVAEELASRARAGSRQYAAVVAVDLYGQCCDYDRLWASCHEHGVPLVEDAAEALGATYGTRQAGSLGDTGILSFNGNKIITTSGGGMLVTDRDEMAHRARHLATQARERFLHYEHVEVGFNYRMSNLLAAVGRGQLRHLHGKVARRREIHSRYREALGDIEGVSFMPEADFGQSTRWLTVALVDPDGFGADSHDLIARFEAADIEARPAWKPMHRQPVFSGSRVIGGSVADSIFDFGICLPSGSGMTDADVDRVIDVFYSCETRRGLTPDGRKFDVKKPVDDAPVTPDQGNVVGGIG
jgi:dTDP-4-amino-4,6-dideoxygalactose transaminase